MDVSPFDLSVFAAKSAVVAIFVIVLYRLLGKREVSQFNLYDLVTVIALSNAVQNAMTAGRGELAVGLTSATSLVLIAFLMARLFVHVPASQRLLLGSPVLLIHNGHCFRDRLKHEHVSEDELMAALRAHGLVAKSEVGMAVLEIDGSISIIPIDALDPDAPVEI